MRAGRCALAVIFSLSQVFTAAYAGAGDAGGKAAQLPSTSVRLGDFYYGGPLDLDVIPQVVPLNRKNGFTAFELKFLPGLGASGHSSSVPIVGIGIKEGPALEMLLWGSGGAVAGSLAGPMGTIVGATVGAAAGFVIGLIYAPPKTPAHNNLDRQA